MLNLHHSLKHLGEQNSPTHRGCNTVHLWTQKNPGRLTKTSEISLISPLLLLLLDYFYALSRHFNCLDVDRSFYCVFYGLQAKVHPYVLPTAMGGTEPRVPQSSSKQPQNSSKKPQNSSKQPQTSSNPLPQRAAEPIPPWGHLTITEVQDVTEPLQQTISIKHNVRHTTFFHLNCVKIKGKKLHSTERACGTERWGATGGPEVRGDWREPSCTEGADWGYNWPQAIIFIGRRPQK